MRTVQLTTSIFYLACAVVAMIGACFCLVTTQMAEIRGNRLGLTQVGLLFAIFCLLMAKP